MAIGDKKPIVMEYDRAVAGGIATLGADGKLTDAQIPGLGKLGAAPGGYGWGEQSLAVASDADSYAGNGRFVSSTNVPTAQSWIVDQTQYSAGRIEQTAHRTGSALSEIAVRKYTKELGWSPWEWVNPPMAVGIEYRTTERYLGKPVYVKAVDFGAMPNATNKNVAWGGSKAIAVTGVAKVGEQHFTLPIASEVIIWVNGGNVTIKTSTDYSTWTAVAVIKYIKD